MYRLVYAQICDRFVYEPSTCVCTLQTIPRDLMSVSSDAAVKLESSVGRFNGFQVERVLGESDRTKFVAVLGRYAELENARDLPIAAKHFTRCSDGPASQIRLWFCYQGDHLTQLVFKAYWRQA